MTSVHIPHYPNLVQHLRYRGESGDTHQPMKYTDLRVGEVFGVASLFALKYMGRAEFEWGAIPTAREKLAELLAKCGWLDPIEIQHGPHSCWFVGASHDMDMARLFFAEELAADYCSRTKEYTQLQQSYTNPNEYSPEGWWVLTPLPGFAIFKCSNHAQEFIRALRDHK